MGHLHPLSKYVLDSWHCSVLHREAYTAAMPSKLIWIETQSFQGFGCSECNWVFKSSGELVGESLEKMKEKYEAQRDKEFAAHVCDKHPRASVPKTE
jgi:hypothetical protein